MIVAFFLLLFFMFLFPFVVLHVSFHR
jgi:hypothetical protein